MARAPGRLMFISLKVAGGQVATDQQAPSASRTSHKPDAVRDAADLERLVRHETLGHAGLRGLFGGAELDTLLDRLARARRAEVAAMAKARGLDMQDAQQRRMAAEEVLAELAQTHPEMGWVRELLALIKAKLREWGVLDANTLSDAEILREYVIPARNFIERGRVEKERMTEGMAPAFMRIGQDAGQVIDNERAYRELTAINDIVNKQIASWSNGGMKSNVILDLGIPSDVLQKFGIPSLPIKLTQSVLVKATQRHKVAVSDLKDLALNIHAPLAIFASKHGTDHIVLVTEARHRDGNIVAAIDLSVTRRNVIINDIRSVYPKQDENVAKWIEDGYLLGVEKRKGRDWLENSAGSNSQQDQAMAAFDNLTVYDTDHLRKPPGQKL